MLNMNLSTAGHVPAKCQLLTSYFLCPKVGLPKEVCTYSKGGALMRDITYRCITNISWCSVMF